MFTKNNYKIEKLKHLIILWIGYFMDNNPGIAAP